jgi:hypothetical protein
MVRSPDDLRLIQDRSENRRISGFDEAADAKWYNFVLKKFWAGKPSPPELGGLESWRVVYEQLHVQREEAQQVSRMRIDDAERDKKKKKLSKIVDISAVMPTSQQPKATGRSPPKADKKTPAEKKSLSTDFEKMLRSRH